MADFTKTVELIFGGKDEVSPTIRDITKSLDTFQTGVEKISDPLAKVADLILKADTAIVALASTMIGVSINEAAKFAEQMNSIGIEFGGTREQIDAFSSDIIKFGQSSGQSFDEITKATNAAVDAGVAYTDALTLLTNTEKLSTVSHTDFGDTTALVAKTLNVYGANVTEAAHISEAFFALTRTGVIEVSDLNDKFLKLATTTAQIGIPFDDLIAALATLTAHGVPASDAFKTLSSVISSIIDPSKQATDLAKQLGISFDSTALSTKGLDGLLIDVARSTGGNVEQMKTLFGSLGSVKTAMILGSETGTTFRQSLDDIKNSADGLAQAYGLMADDLSRINQNLINNIHAVLIGVGTPLLAQFGQDVQSISEVFKSLRFSIDAGAFNPIFDSLNAFGSEFEASLRKIAANLPAALQSDKVQAALLGLVNAFGDVGRSIAGLFDGADLTTEKGLEDALTKLLNVIKNLVEISSRLINTFKPMFDAIAAGADKFGNLGDGALGFAGSLLGISKQVDVILPIMANLATTISGLFIIFGGIKNLKIETSLLAAATATDAFATASRALFLLAWGDFVYKLASWADINDRLIPGIDTLGTKIYEWTHSSEEAANATIKLTKPIADLGANIDEYSDKARAAAESSSELGKSGSFIEQQFTAALLPFDKLIESFNSLSDSSNKANDSSKAIVKTFVDGVPTFSNAGTAISNVYKSTGTSAEDATKKTDAYQLKLLELASDERIKTIEATVTLNVAELESKTKIATALIEGLGTTIQSTGDLLGTLFGTLKEDLSFQNLFLVQKAIEKEMEIREEATKKQNELIDAQIRNIQAQTDALSRGDSLITIQGDGLAPELEAFMMAVLERIQIRASQDRALYLLGAPA